MSHPNPSTAALAHMSLAIDVTGWTDQQVNDLRAAAANIAAASDSPALISDDDIESTGWTKDVYIEAMTRLLRKHHVQVACIFETAKTGSPFVSRERVYEIGSYPETRSLKGFTRPVNRVQQDLVDEALLPEDAADLLETVYDPNVAGYQRAIGFRVPLEIIQIAQRAKAAQDAQGA